MKLRVSIFVVAVVTSMMTASFAVVAADGHGAPVARFDASAQIQFVGLAQSLEGIPGIPPLEEGSTNVGVIRGGRDGTIRQIRVNTVNEAAGAGPLSIDGCRDRGTASPCDAIRTVLGGGSVLSFHESLARLGGRGGVVVAQIPPAALGAPGLPYQIETYSGNLRGALNGEFEVEGASGVLKGDTRLRIRGESTYACFGDLSQAAPIPSGVFGPLPSVDYCENDSPRYGPENLFLSIEILVEDHGRFTLSPSDELVVDGLKLESVSGRLTVVVDAGASHLDPSSEITISNAVARFSRSDDDDEEAGPDLAVSKASFDAGPVSPGDRVSYKVTVENIGSRGTPQGGDVVRVREELPDGSDFRWYSASKGICSQSGDGDLECELGRMAPGEQVTINLVVEAPSACGTMTNRVTVDYWETIPEVNEENNTAILDTEVEC